jgi:hypothetical protein
MKKIKIKKNLEKGIVNKTTKLSLTQEYLKKQKKLTKETLRKVVNSAKREIDNAIK